MKIRIYSLLLCGFALGSLSALAQQSLFLKSTGLWHWITITT